MNPLRIVILNPCLIASPLNFRGWLREKLKRYERGGQVKHHEVTGILFLTKAYRAQLGTKNLQKILSGAINKRPWLVAIETVLSDVPMSDADADLFLTHLQDNYRIEEQLAELGDADPLAPPDADQVDDTWLGYPTTAIHEGQVDLASVPACVVRKVRISDFDDVLKDRQGYAVGSWFVVATDPETFETDISQAFALEDEALADAGLRFDISRFLPLAEVQAARLQEGIDGLLG